MLAASLKKIAMFENIELRGKYVIKVNAHIRRV